MVTSFFQPMIGNFDSECMNMDMNTKTGSYHHPYRTRIICLKHSYCHDITNDGNVFYKWEYDT